MSLIKKPHELKVVVYPKVLVYGQPGIGKTTLALSAPAPLLFDFDNGVHRVNTKHQVPTVQIESWQNMLDVLNNEDLSDFKTFVIDTAGKMLDYMGQWLISNNAKLGKSNGALSLQGYGERKAEFRNFLKRVALMGKNLVFVAHDMEEKDGEQKIIRPEIGGSSGADLIKELDLVGYMEAVGNQRTISFDPCEKFYGKNTCQLPPKVQISDVVKGTAENNYLVQVFNDYQNNLKERQRIGAEYLELMAVIEAKVEAIEDVDAANEVTEWALTYTNHIWDSKLQAGMKLREKAKQLGFVFNKEAKRYELPAKAAEPAQPEPAANNEPANEPAAESQEPAAEQKNEQQPEHIEVTQEMLDADPALAESGVAVGDKIYPAVVKAGAGEPSTNGTLFDGQKQNSSTKKTEKNATTA